MLPTRPPSRPSSSPIELSYSRLTALTLGTGEGSRRSVRKNDAVNQHPTTAATASCFPANIAPANGSDAAATSSAAAATIPQPASLPEHPNRLRHSHIPPSRLTPTDARVADLASKLEAMERGKNGAKADGNENGAPSVASSLITGNEILHSKAGAHRFPRKNPLPGPLLSDVYDQTNGRKQQIVQFIDTLKNMQSAASRSEDDSQRVKKSRALHSLLSMFENIIDQRLEAENCLAAEVADSGQGGRRNGEDEELLRAHHEMASTCEELENQNTNMEKEIQEMDEALRFLENENDALRHACDEKEQGLERTSHEMRAATREVHSSSVENSRLENDLSLARERWENEQDRACEAEKVASGAERVRDGLMSNYGRITEENLKLERAIDEQKSELNRLVLDLGCCGGKLERMQGMLSDSKQEVRKHLFDVTELQGRLDLVNADMAAKDRAAAAAEADRRRLEDELRSSQRNSTANSEQIMKLQNRLVQSQREADNLRKSKSAKYSDFENYRTILEEERERRRGLEMVISKSRAKEVAANEQIRKLARSNADLKTKVNEASARLSGSLKNRYTYTSPASGVTPSASDVVSQLNLSLDSQTTNSCQPNLMDYLHPD